MTEIDLSQLPSPKVIETLDFEVILAARKEAFLSLYPEEQQAEMSNRLALESEPLTKLLQEGTYRELLLRQRINDAARAVMLAHAQEADLDQIGANYNVFRLTLDVGDLTASPPRAPVYESDNDFRRRIQLSPEGYTTAGSEQSYVFHGLSADADVADSTKRRCRSSARGSSCRAPAPAGQARRRPPNGYGLFHPAVAWRTGQNPRPSAY